MSLWWLTDEQSVFTRYHSKKHLSDFWKNDDSFAVYDVSVTSLQLLRPRVEIVTLAYSYKVLIREGFSATY